MARRVSRGEIWLYEFKQPDKRLPVVVLSRPEALALLHDIMVAPMTSTIRGAPGEVLVGTQMGEVCRALAIATGCD
jgi:mRNA interferase MazF